MGMKVGMRISSTTDTIYRINRSNIIFLGKKMGKSSKTKIEIAMWMTPIVLYKHDNDYNTPVEAHQKQKRESAEA